jgi:hypothetical protein
MPLTFWLSLGARAMTNTFNPLVQWFSSQTLFAMRCTAFRGTMSECVKRLLELNSHNQGYRPSPSNEWQALQTHELPGWRKRHERGPVICDRLSD